MAERRCPGEEPRAIDMEPETLEARISECGCDHRSPPNEAGRARAWGGAGVCGRGAGAAGETPGPSRRQGYGGSAGRRGREFVHRAAMGRGEWTRVCFSSPDAAPAGVGRREWDQ